jgi:hypothetical protein
MPVSAEPAAVSRVQSRQIAEGDLDVLVDKLTSGFPIHTRDFWYKGLARIAQRPAIEHMPRFGYLLETDSGPVGLILTIWSKRDRQIICNLSSWCVERPYRRPHATSLPVMATSIDGPIYLNTSPADHTRKTMETLGWMQYNFGRSVAFPALAPGRGRVSDDIPSDLPERNLLEDHRALGCVSVVCKRNGAVSPFVFRPRKVTRLRLPIMELIYCRNTSDFENCGGALGRHFLMRGFLGFILDGKVRHMPSIYAEGKEPRLYKGPRPPQLNDLAYTEKVIFG